MIILEPSILAADFSRLGEEIRAVTGAGADAVHLDVMDGYFVPSISFGMPLLTSIRRCTDAFFDVHMMVQEPIRYVEEIRNCGADLICVHAEACRHLDSTLRLIRKTGAMAGVAINPATPVEAGKPVLSLVDQVLVMTVNPGFGGQELIPYTLEKVRQTRQLCRSLGLSSMRIQVDGGVTLANVRQILEAGADVVVTGSSVFRGDAGENTRKFLQIFRKFAS